jgi:hypothetical protein
MKEIYQTVIKTKIFFLKILFFPGYSTAISNSLKCFKLIFVNTLSGYPLGNIGGVAHA